MRDSVYLAWRYLRFHPMTTLLIIAAITLILYLPAALQVIVNSAEGHFRERAASTPLVVGPRGSSLDLVLGSVYFHQPCDDILRLEQVGRIDEQGLGTTIPIHSRFTTRDCPVVGTTDAYFPLRQLRISQGRSVEIHGECLIGSAAAKKLGVEIGDRIPVSKSSVFVLDNPPLRLNVVGVLEGTETPDDEAIFVDLETTWIVEGLGHGHAPDTKHGEPGSQLQTDITKENLSRVHFHGDRNRFPVSAVIVVPDSKKSETLLLGQYFSPDETAQIARPRDVIDAMLKRVVMIRSYMIAIIVLISLVTLLMMGLVIALSIRLRQSEIITISKIGGSRFKIASIVGSQILIIVGFSIAGAAALTWATQRFASQVVHFLISSA